MAFLDNSGDIILDAVLTTVGRKRMAEGNFRITKYAFGDDEIDYGNFILNTGSAYQDLTVLTTPILEATTATGTGVQNALLSLSRTDLLYIPTLKVNEVVKNGNAAFTTSSVYYFATNTETYDKLVTFHSGSKYVLQNNALAGAKIMIESGLDGAGADGLLGTNSNRNQYIVNNNLQDSKITVYVDNRFIGGVLGPDQSSVFANQQPDGQEHVKFTLQKGDAGGSAMSLNNYSAYTCNGVINKVTYVSNGSALKVSAINGPRGTATALNFVADQELTSIAAGARSAKFDMFGTIDSVLFGDGLKFDYIDMVAYVVGNASSAQLQMPIRIIRYAGT